MTLFRPLLVFLLLGLAAPAWANEENPEYTRAKAEASRAFQAKDYAGAAQLFEQAFNAEPRGNLLYNIGLCWEKANDVGKAVVFYERFVSAMPNSPKRPAVQRKIAELQQQLVGSYVEVSVATNPPGAIIFVDDKAKGAMGAAPITFKLLPGRYTIIAELADHEPGRAEIQLAEGRRESVDLRLVGSGRVGEVTLLISERGAKVLVDGQAAGTSPLTEPLRLPAGARTIRVVKPGFAPFEQQVQVRAGGEERVQVSLSSEGGELSTELPPAGGGGGGGGGSGPGIWPWVVVGVGAAALGGGVVTGLSAQSLHDQLSDKEANSELIAPSDIDTGKNLVLMTNVLYGVGTAAIAGGLAWWYLGAPQGPATSGDVLGSVGLGPDGRPSVMVGGSF